MFVHIRSGASLVLCFYAFIHSFIHSIHPSIHSAECLCHFPFSLSLSILLLSISQNCFGVDGILLVYLSYVFLCSFSFVFLVEFGMFMTYGYDSDDDQHRRRHQMDVDDDEEDDDDEEKENLKRILQRMYITNINTNGSRKKKNKQKNLRRKTIKYSTHTLLVSTSRSRRNPLSFACTVPSVSSKHFIIPYFSRRVDSLMTKLWFRLHMYLCICVFVSFVCVCDCERVHVYTFAKYKINIYTQHQNQQQPHPSLRSSHFSSFFSILHFVSVRILFLRHQTNVWHWCVRASRGE